MSAFVFTPARFSATGRSFIRQSRFITTTSSLAEATPLSDLPSSSQSEPQNTHFKITLRRSAISLGEKKQGTLVSLGIHRRFQTVYHRHTPEVAGKILKVKELLEVENVPDHLVRTKEQQRQERKASRGYQVVGSQSPAVAKGQEMWNRKIDI